MKIDAESEFVSVAQSSWKDRLEPREKKQIPEIFQSVVDMAEQTLKNFKTDGEETNRIAVVLSAYDASNLLPETLREIAEQLKNSSLGGEIYLVMNNGGGNSTDFINSNTQQAQIESIARKIGVNEIIFGRTEELSEATPNSKATPRKVVLDKDIPTKVDGLKLVVVEQQNEPDNQGKIRGLRNNY